MPTATLDKLPPGTTVATPEELGLTEGKPETQRPITEYVLLGGTHVQNSPDKVYPEHRSIPKEKWGTPVEEHFQFSNGEPPPIVRSRENLAADFPTKFRRADAYSPAGAVPIKIEIAPEMDKLLETLDAVGLAGYARGMKIDVGDIDPKKPGAKEQLLRAVRAGLVEQARQRA